MRKSTRIPAAIACISIATGGAVLAGDVAHAEVAVPIVTVKMKEFKLTLAPVKLPSGRVTLVALNKGTLPHALAIKGRGVNARTAVLPAGKSARLSVTLTNGSYTVWCPVANHATSGMKVIVRVASSSSSPTPAPQPSTPPPTTTYPDPYY